MTWVSFRRSALIVGFTSISLGCSPDAPESAAMEVTRLLNLGAADAGFATAEAPRAFVFPADHGVHPEYRSEWWYLTAALKDAQGLEYGVQFTVFRQALAPEQPTASPNPGSADGWVSNQAYMAHFAITSLVHGEHREDQRFARGHPRLAGVRAAPFAAWVDGWTLESIADLPGGEPGGENAAGEEFSMRHASFEPMKLNADAPDRGIGARLALRPTRAPILQGDRGLSRKGENSASYYYSVTRLAIEGALEFDGATVQVTGIGWFDREWSTSSLADEHVGWDWFALMLDDGEDVMAFRLRRRAGERDPFDYAMRRFPGGEQRTYNASEFELQPTRWWRDDDGTAWPVAWSMEIGKEDVSKRLLIEAALDDQRMATSVAYWEGLIHVKDVSGARIGSGYMELTGYQR